MRGVKELGVRVEDITTVEESEERLFQSVWKEFSSFKQGSKNVLTCSAVLVKVCVAGNISCTLCNIVHCVA